MDFSFRDIEYLACEVPEGIRCFKYAGMYDKEVEAIERFLEKDNITPAMRTRLELEKVLALGMSEDYTLTFDAALAEMRKTCAEITSDELMAMVYDGRADWRLRNGEICFQDSFVSSAMINSPELFWRNAGKREMSKKEKMVVTMEEKGSYSLRHTIRHTVWPEPKPEFEGKKILVHIPVPIETEAQTNIVIRGMTEGGYISDAAQRTVSFETVYHSGMEFFVEYSFDATQKYTKPEADKVSPVQPTDFTDEEYPHIRFTPYLRKLCEYIVGDETNALLKARKIYDYVTMNIKYSYMREYLLIENLPEFAALNFRGDCGVQGLLFITLCRIAGIGAQWQSGMSIGEGYVGSHDWARFCIEPYGWLYCDLSSGGGAFREGNEEKRDFYFSNVEPMRMAANSSFQCDFDPPKKFIRIDPYDNQIGEIEFEDEGLRLGDMHFRRELISTEEI